MSLHLVKVNIHGTSTKVPTVHVILLFNLSWVAKPVHQVLQAVDFLQGRSRMQPANTDKLWV
jgi:hypothetical protein